MITDDFLSKTDASISIALRRRSLSTRLTWRPNSLIEPSPHRSYHCEAPKPLETHVPVKARGKKRIKKEGGKQRR